MAKPIKAPSASRQVAFHQLLVSARRTWLIDALTEALSRTDTETLKNQLSNLIPSDVQKILLVAGIRDEHIFPAPALLEQGPTVVGYYRLLLGVPQKTFYGSNLGLAMFKSMEVKGTINPRQRAHLPAFCQAMSVGLADLVRQISPTITARDIAELPLLTLGSFFQGANNVIIGKQAIAGVYLAIVEIVESHIVERNNQSITIANAAGRKVHLSLGSDPDVRIEENFSGQLRPKVAIEIKGGTDKSNAHNRAGEAEKSHQKARSRDFRDCWTIIAKKGLDMAKLESESPTTNSWFDVAQVLAREGDDWNEFRSRIADVVGIPMSEL